MSDQIDVNAEIITETLSDNQTAEEYAYLDRGGFSSEKFKIEVRGLPKFYGIAVRNYIMYLFSVKFAVFEWNNLLEKFIRLKSTQCLKLI